MKEINKTQAIILLLILIAIGGLVLYGKKDTTKEKVLEPHTKPPLIKGPTTPPPGYAAPR